MGDWNLPRFLCAIFFFPQEELFSPHSAASRQEEEEEEEASKQFPDQHAGAQQHARDTQTTTRAGPYSFSRFSSSLKDKTK